MASNHASIQEQVQLAFHEALPHKVIALWKGYRSDILQQGAGVVFEGRTCVIASIVTCVDFATLAPYLIHLANGNIKPTRKVFNMLADACKTTVPPYIENGDILLVEETKQFIVYLATYAKHWENFKYKSEQMALPIALLYAAYSIVNNNADMTVVSACKHLLCHLSTTFTFHPLSPANRS